MDSASRLDKPAIVLLHHQVVHATFRPGRRFARPVRIHQGSVVAEGDYMQDLQPEAAIGVWREIHGVLRSRFVHFFLRSKELPFITVFRIERRLFLAAALRPCLGVSSELSSDGSVVLHFDG